jgi:preprotein translocase subunit SecG
MEIHIFLGLMIPVAFFGFAGAIKCLVKTSWTLGNFYLGIDIALAAMANGIVNVVDLVHQAEGHAFTPEFASEMTNTTICIVVSFAALLLTMGLHQRFDVPGESNNGNRRIARGILLGVVANLAGVCALGLFIYWKLRRLV